MNQVNYLSKMTIKIGKKQKKDIMSILMMN